MALPRMERHLAIIRVLDHGDSTTQQQTMRKTGFNSDLSREVSNFLAHLGIIKGKTVGPKTVYTLTDKGQRSYAYFGLDDDNPIFRGTGIFRID